MTLRIAIIGAGRIGEEDRATMHAVLAAYESTAQKTIVHLAHEERSR